MTGDKVGGEEGYGLTYGIMFMRMKMRMIFAVVKGQGYNRF